MELWKVSWFVHGFREVQLICGWNYGRLVGLLMELGKVSWFVDGIREGQLVCGWN
jgi:hypothetical protein